MSQQDATSAQVEAQLQLESQRVKVDIWLHSYEYSLSPFPSLSLSPYLSLSPFLIFSLSPPLSLSLSLSLPPSLPFSLSLPLNLIHMSHVYALIHASTPCSVQELSQALEDVKQARDELKFENTDLQTQLRLGRVRSKQPLSSTPYRPCAPSWHEEMMEQECLTSKSSPILRYSDDVSGVGGVNGVRQEVGGEVDEESMVGLSASDSFTKILEETVSLHGSIP